MTMIEETVVTADFAGNSRTWKLTGKAGHCDRAMFERRARNRHFAGFGNVGFVVSPGQVADIEEERREGMTWQEAWDAYFAAHPEIAAEWGHQNGRWPRELQRKTDWRGPMADLP